MRKHILEVVVFVTLISLIVVGQVKAEETDLPKTIINPDVFLYPLKRLQENIFLKFTSEKDLYNFHNQLLKTRLAELRHVTEKKLLGHIEKSSQRVAYQAGILSDYIKSKKGDKEIEEQVKNFVGYKQMLIGLRDLYQANSSYWMLIQQDIDTLDLNAAKFKK